MIKKKINKAHLQMIVFRDDTIPAFAAYIKDSVKSGIPIVFLNISSTFICAVEENVEAKEIFITSLMHEFGHALEDFFDLPVNEEFMHRVTEKFQEEYHKRKDSIPPKQNK
jgi:hypothetical protein